MTDYADHYSRVLRYSAADKAAFESAIDANPLEATTHLVYADWLDDNGEPEEAAFRRAVGRWHQDNAERGFSPNADKKLAGFVYPWQIPLWHHNRTGFPDGVWMEHLPQQVVGYGEREPTADPVRPRFVGGSFHWKTYRSMEEAFRQAFKAGRNSE